MLWSRAGSRQHPSTLLPSAPFPGQMLRRDPTTAPSLSVCLLSRPLERRAVADPPPGEFPGLRPNISHHLSPPRTGIPQGGEGQGKDPGYCLNPCLLSRSPASLQTCFLLHSKYFREAPRRQARTRTAVALGTPVPIALPAVPPQSEPRPPAQRSLFPAGELSA